MNSDSARIHSPDPFLRAESEERTPPNSEKENQPKFCGIIAPKILFPQNLVHFLNGSFGDI